MFLPTQTPAKRAAAAAETSHATKHQRGNSGGFPCLCGAIETIALSLGGPLSTPSHLETTPQRRARAIALVENNDDLSDEEQLRAIGLFSNKPEIADSYIAIKKPTLRVKFLQAELKKFHPY
jgi:hypothetical protein